MRPINLAVLAISLGVLSLGASAATVEIESDPFVSFELFHSKHQTPKEAFRCPSSPASGKELLRFLKAECHRKSPELGALLTSLESTFLSTRDDMGLCMLGRYFAARQQPERVIPLFKASAKLGNLNAMYFLGVAYQEGQGVKVSLVKSYVYLYLSLLRGQNTQDAQARLSRLAERMSSKQQASAAMQLGGLYWRLRQIDSMRYPSRFSAGILVPDYLDAFCFLPKELANEK